MDFYEEHRESSFVAKEIKEPPVGRTRIQNYYKDKTVLVTGGTGFLGTLIIEKLLRCCPDLKKLIIFLRPKRGKSLTQRAIEHFKDPVFDKLRKCNPNYWKIIEIINADCEKPNWDIEPDEWNRLQKEVNVIFHSAATVRFDEHIRISYNTNVVGTKYLLKLAEGASNLTAFVYVSTAYSQSHLQYIEEDFYPTAFSDEQMIQLLEQLDSNTLACMTPIILDGRYNTYVTTKSMAENVIKTYMGKFPIAIFRPSIVTATIEDPLTSWTSSIAGLTGVFLGVAVGFLRTLYCDPNASAEVIPCDRVISALLTVPLHIQVQATIKSNTSNKIQEKNEFIPIYNYVAKNRITWFDQMEIFFWVSKTGRFLKNMVIMWPPHSILEKHYTLWILEFYILHLLPLPVFLLMEKLSKQPPRLWKLYMKLLYYTKQYSFFMIKSWNFSSKNVADLIEFTDENDKNLFNADNTIDWKSYNLSIPTGIGKHILKLDIQTFTEDKFQTKGAVMRFIDNAFIWIMKSLLVWLLIKSILAVIGYIFQDVN